MFTDEASAASREALLKHELYDLKHRIVGVGGITDGEYDDIHREYLKFMFLAGLGLKTRTPVGMHCEKVDIVWHQHILHSRQYVDFCIKFFGEHIHHDPAANPHSVQECNDSFVVFRALYEEHFGPINPMWGPQAGEACSHHHWEGGKFLVKA